MSGSKLLTIGGRTYAAGLVWLIPRSDEGRKGWTLRQARQFGSAWYAQREHQTGFWDGEEPGEFEGPSRALAHDVEGSIDTAGLGTWQALVKCDDDRYAIVRGRADEIFAKGDVVVDGLERALERFRSDGNWDVVYATPGLVDGARLLKLVEPARRCALQPVPLARAAQRRRLAAVACVAVVLGALGYGGFQGWRWYEAWRHAKEEQERARIEEVIKEGVDVAVFLEHCEKAQAEAPTLPPMWERTYLGCHQKAEDIPELGGRIPGGALFGRWRRHGAANPAISRRLVERKLNAWDVGGVLVTTAWAGVEVDAPIREWHGDQPSTVEFRATLDRAVGTLGVVTYSQTPDGFKAELRTRYPASVVRERVSAIQWLDMLSYGRSGENLTFAFVRVDPRVVVREVDQEVE